MKLTIFAQSSKIRDQAAAASLLQAPPTTTTTQKPTTAPEDAPSLLAQDLELRRLLSESHLFSSPLLSLSRTGTGAEPAIFSAGRIRHRATDMRVQALGSRIASVHSQDKMPMNMRKGITAAATAREAKRRREARENGVVLERETGGGGGGGKGSRGGSGGRKRKGRTWDAAIDRPGVGRMRGAELRLSERDVKRIEDDGRDTFRRKRR